MNIDVAQSSIHLCLLYLSFHRTNSRGFRGTWTSFKRLYKHSVRYLKILNSNLEQLQMTNKKKTTKLCNWFVTLLFSLSCQLEAKIS